MPYNEVDQLYKNLRDQNPDRSDSWILDQMKLQKVNNQVNELDKSFQVGGNHYSKLAIQPFDIIEQNNLNFWEGNVLKYLLRYKDKNGVQDLEKAQHYLAKLIEIQRKKGNVK